MQRYELFAAWCKTNGVIAPKLKYPTYFDGLCGVGVTEDIQHNEVVYCIPYRLIMTVEKARKVPELAKVFGANPELF
jgi:hypothetical protein